MFRKITCTVLGLVLAASCAWATQLPLPAVNGPYLGDQLNNLYQVTLAYITESGMESHPSLSASQTAGQANCTQLDQSALQEVLTSASTGYVCLPPAQSGKEVLIANASGQTIDLYGSATPAVSGTQDYINGTIGTTAYTNLTNGKSADCFVPHTGFWYCSSGN
jgi:hypothetical protein